VEHYDQNNLRFWPLESMSRFGQNPFGDNKWRIVHAPSRRSLVHGEGKKPQWIQTYPQAGTCWVLEKWLSAYDFTKCTAETWNMSMTLLGPYPSRGEYELAHTFSNLIPSDVNIEKLISLIEAGKNRYSAYENSVSLRDEALREENSERNQRLAKIHNLLPAFGNAPMSGRSGGRGTKTFDLPLTAQSAGLPTKAGRIRQTAGIKKYDVSELITA
jgi:hypothetical protein